MVSDAVALSENNVQVVDAVMAVESYALAGVVLEILQGVCTVMRGHQGLQLFKVQLPAHDSGQDGVRQML